MTDPERVELLRAAIIRYFTRPEPHADTYADGKAKVKALITALKQTGPVPPELKSAWLEVDS